MNHRGDPSSILIFLLLIIAVLFQINLYTKNRRLDQDLSRFMSAQSETGSEKNVHSERDTCLAEMPLNKRFKNVNIHRVGPNLLGQYVPKGLQKYE